jgi:hypothetical protein
MSEIQDRDIEDFEFGEDAKIDIFRPYVDLVLYAFGFSPDEVLWVSDESIVADFLADDEDLFNASQRLGFEFEESDFVWEVAAKLRKTSEE